ncbi:alpha/beta hydrolase, partial [bacterium]|nr:alpha/beta hydrolase [bacterium]
MKPQTLILVLSLFLFSLNGLANDLIQPSQNKGILVEEPIFEGNFYLEESGKQNPINVVLCHGTGNLGAKIWKDLIPELEKKYHVFAFDLPGFGRSDKNNELYSPENYTYFLKWFIDTHMKGKVYLVGHSMGGAIALYYAGKYPDNLDRLILIDAAGILHRAAFTNNILEGYLSGELKVGNQDLLERPLKGLKYLVKSTIETFDEKFMPDNMKQPLHLSTFRQKVLKGDPIKISGMALIHADFGQIIDHVKVPTYLIWGEKDSIAPVRTAKILAANIPETYLKIMPGLEHSPMLDHPDRFNEQVLKYLSDYPSEKFAKATDGKPFKDSDRVRSYKGKKDLTIKGNFKRIELIDCENILIK